MLDDLDRIDWAHIRHSHGHADEFPAWIRQLRSEIPDVREEARRNLFEYSHHQGSIYEVTPFLVPFLVELATAPDTPEREHLLYHLGSLGRSCNWAVARSIYGGDAHETHERIKAGLEQYLVLLDDSDTQVRLGAFFAASSIRMFVPLWNIVERFKKVIAHETDPGIKAEMIGFLKEYVEDSFEHSGTDPVAQHSEALAAFLLAQTGSEEHPRVRFVAALAYLELLGEWRVEAAHLRAILGDALLNPEEYGESGETFAILSVIERAIAGLLYIPRAERMADLAAGLKAARYPEDAHLIGQALLDTIFLGLVREVNPIARPRRLAPYLARRRLSQGQPAERPDNSDVPFRPYYWQTQDDARQVGWFYINQPPPADLAALSATERDMLRLVLDADLVWMIHSNLLAAYGLPATRAEVIRLLVAL